MKAPSIKEGGNDTLQKIPLRSLRSNVRQNWYQRECLKGSWTAFVLLFHGVTWGVLIMLVWFMVQKKMREYVWRTWEKQRIFLSEGYKWRNASHIPYFCINVYITETHFDRVMIILEDLSRMGDIMQLKIPSQDEWVRMDIRNTGQKKRR